MPDANVGGTPTDGRRRLWPIWLALPTVTVTAAVLAVGAGLLLWVGFGRPPLVKSWDATTELDIVRVALIIVGGLGGIVALVVAYRRQRLSEDAHTREEARLFNERFIAASTLLGHESAAVRGAAVTAIVRLADDWFSQRQTCIDVLCTYIRLPYESEGFAGEREVRASIIRAVRDHLRLDGKDARSWRGRDFDFTNATFDYGDFNGATFSGGAVSFLGATFSGEVSFQGATFAAGRVSFYRATFPRGLVSFHGATFSGNEVLFDWADFGGGLVAFTHATFSGSQVSFTDATFSAGQVPFVGAKFSGGEVSFVGAKFTGGLVSFVGATFSGGLVSFAPYAVLGSDVNFDRDVRLSPPRGLQLPRNMADESDQPNPSCSSYSPPD